MEMLFTLEDVGKIGKDDRGMRFLVVDPKNVDFRNHEHPMLAVLPGGKYGIPGTLLHFSWAETPITWENETT